MTHTPSRIKPTKESFFKFSIKPLLTQCRIEAHRVTGFSKNSTPFDLIFFNCNQQCGWLTYKIATDICHTNKKKFTPDWNQGELNFLRQIERHGQRVGIVMQLKSRTYYSWGVQKDYTVEELIPFTLIDFIL